MFKLCSQNISNFLTNTKKSVPLLCLSWPIFLNTLILTLTIKENFRKLSVINNKSSICQMLSPFHAVLLNCHTCTSFLMFSSYKESRLVQSFVLLRNLISKLWICFIIFLVGTHSHPYKKNRNCYCYIKCIPCLFPCFTF